jgi:POT family proton-dependent oligopeptide transporter
MVQNNIALKSLQPIMILRFISTVTFGVFYSSLSLLMIQTFNLTNEMAASLAALFFGFHYALPLLGGKLSDNIKNFKQIFLTGKVFQLISSFVLIFAINHQEYLYLGLSFFLVDSMVNTVSLNMFITNHFEQNNADERRAAFLRGHVWSNLGFIVALFLSGAIYHFANIEFLFYITAIFSSLTIIYCYFFIDQDSGYSSENLANSSLKLLLIMMTIALVTTISLTNYYFTREVIIISAALSVFLILIKSISTVSKSEVNGILRFMVFMLCSVLFWTIDMLCPIFIPIFINNDVNTVIFGFNLPPQWIQIISPLITVTAGAWLSKVLSDILNNRGTSFSRTHFFISGLVCTSCALLLLGLGVNQHSLGLQLSYWWIVGYIIIMAISELLIAPISMALVGECIPKKHHGIYTGINQMTIGVSVIFSGFLAEYFLMPSSYNLANSTISNYSSIFVLLAMSMLVAGGFLFMFDRKLYQKVI